MIKNQDFAEKFINFNSLQFGSISPTDIDGFIEYKDKWFIFIETKFNKAQMPRGQELALERLCDAVQSETKNAIVFFTSHQDDGIDVEIDIGLSLVTKYRYMGKWVKPKAPINLHDAIERLIPNDII